MMRWMTIVLLLAVLSMGALAHADDGHDLPWYAVAGGGATSTGGGYSLSGTIGQPDAGLLTGGKYTLGGGFWGGGAVVGVAYDTYLPLVVQTEP